MFTACMKRLREEGSDQVKHKEPLTEEDMKIVMTRLNESTPCGLQQKVSIYT